MHLLNAPGICHVTATPLGNMPRERIDGVERSQHIGQRRRGVDARSRWEPLRSARGKWALSAGIVTPAAHIPWSSRRVRAPSSTAGAAFSPQPGAPARGEPVTPFPAPEAAQPRRTLSPAAQKSLAKKAAGGPGVRLPGVCRGNDLYSIAPWHRAGGAGAAGRRRAAGRCSGGPSSRTWWRPA